MAKSEFLRNLRTARNLFEYEVVGDGSSTGSQVAASLSRADLWLTPVTVRGFDPRDFPELPDDVRENLSRDVDRFRNIATHVSPDGPATEEQATSARSALESILQLLTAYLPSGEELQRIRVALHSLEYPEFVRTFNFEVGLDSTNESAIWIWVFVDDEATRGPAFREESRKIRDAITEGLCKAGIERWPYIQFRTVAEQRALGA